MGARMEIAKAVKSMGGTISMFEEERMDLQRVFLKLIEESSRDGWRTGYG